MELYLNSFLHGLHLNILPSQEISFQVLYPELTRIGCLPSWNMLLFRMRKMICHVCQQKLQQNLQTLWGTAPIMTFMIYRYAPHELYLFELHLQLLCFDNLIANKVDVNEYLQDALVERVFYKFVYRISQLGDDFLFPFLLFQLVGLKVTFFDDVVCCGESRYSFLRWQVGFQLIQQYNMRVVRVIFVGVYFEGGLGLWARFEDFINHYGQGFYEFLDKGVCHLI
eukprot:TRINITY_DN512_c0_g1_i4.p2 TRINITY_DN512_c0_g1~~TRINITY_DN512_c0_g1_i4.p2  ORF type:complete len:225 (-),score=-3.69 TRINITY_DN512_c0_g1_i4:53-727(-)